MRPKRFRGNDIALMAEYAETAVRVEFWIDAARDLVEAAELLESTIAVRWERYMATSTRAVREHEAHDSSPFT